MALGVIFFTLLFSGCASDAAYSLTRATSSTTGAKLPVPSSSFIPPDVINVPPKDLYRIALDLFNDKQIPLVNQDQDALRITTDNITGPNQSILFGLAGYSSLRYRYLVSIREKAKGSELRVKAVLEASTTNDKNISSQWLDQSAISDNNKEIVKNMEYALVEEIEKKAASRR